MAVSCWVSRYSFVRFESSVISGQWVESDEFPEELVDIVGSVCFEDLGLWKRRRVNPARCVDRRVAVVRRKVKCQASVGREL